MTTTIKLVAFDLDGTLTRGRSCLQAVADAFGLAAQRTAVERASTDDDIAAARRALWPHLEPRTPAEIASALAVIPIAPGAAAGVRALRTAGIRTVIVSMALAPNVAYFARLLGVDAYIATEPDGHGDFRHVFPGTKPALLATHARALGLAGSQIAAVGDSAGDVPMLRAAGLSIYLGRKLPDGFSPTWHLPDAPIDEATRIILATAPGD